MIRSAIMVDLLPGVTDEQACRDWSVEPAHRAVSAEFLRPIAERVTRGQIRM